MGQPLSGHTATPQDLKEREKDRPGFGGSHSKL
jgi:hypothetical protein